MPCAIGLDLGTTSVSAAAVADNGQLIAAVTRNHAADTPGLPSGHAEQDPARIQQVAAEALRELTAQLPDLPICLGLTGQMHGVVLVDSARRPVSNLITWQDRRSLEPAPHRNISLLQALLDRCAAQDLEDAGCRPSTGFLGTTLFALRESGTLPATATHAALIVDWLAAHWSDSPLTTDRSNAGSTGLYNLRLDDWSDPLLAAARVPREFLPRVADSGTPVGGLTAAAAQLTGLPVGLPVCNAIGDNQAAIVGSVPVGEDVVQINIGTGGQLSRIVNRYRRVEGMETRYIPPGRYMLVGAGLAGGDAFAWVARTAAAWLKSFGIDWPGDDIYRQLEPLMQTAPEEAAGLRCDPYFRGTRQRPDARGSFTGITTENFTPGNIGRAVLNGIADGMASFRDLASRDAPWPAQRIIATGNAVRRNPLLVQAIARRFGLPLDIPVHREEAAYGAALLAGVETRLWPSLEDAGRFIRYQRLCE